MARHRLTDEQWECVAVHFPRPAARGVHRQASGNLSTACSGFSAPPRRGDGYANCANYPPALKATGLYFNQAIIWDKQHPALTRKDTMGSRVERVGFAWQRGKVFASAS